MSTDTNGNGHDSYKTDTIQADVLVGAGENRQYKPGRVEVTGSLEGWDIATTRVARNPDDQFLERSVVLQSSESRLRLDAVFLQGIQ